MALKLLAHDPGDAIWTVTKEGQFRVYIVLHDGSLSEMNPGMYLQTVKELTREKDDDEH